MKNLSINSPWKTRSAPKRIRAPKIVWPCSECREKIAGVPAAGWSMRTIRNVHRNDSRIGISCLAFVHHVDQFRNTATKTAGRKKVP